MKKLIEVALPLDLINAASALEKNNPFLKGHPRTLHPWWARRPLPAARAVLFAQLVDDPSSDPMTFPTEEAQEQERQRLFRLIGELVEWENTTNEAVLSRARDEIWRSWKKECAVNIDSTLAKELFVETELPTFHDPFAGGGAIPLEAQRLGLHSVASDLNPVSALINKAMIEIPAKFAGHHPVNPAVQATLFAKSWRGAQGLAEDLRYYGRWMRDEAETRIGARYSQNNITPMMAAERPDLKPLVGQKLTVTAWLWARTVRSPNPAFASVQVPLISSFLLCEKAGKEAYIQPVIDGSEYRFAVKLGKPVHPESTKNGTKSGGGGSSFSCLLSGTPMPFEYLRSEGRAGRMGVRLLAMVADHGRGRVYLAPTAEAEAAAEYVQLDELPQTDLPLKALGFRVQEYGLTKWCDLFTHRQLGALETFSSLVQEVRENAKRDGIAAGMPDDGISLERGGTGATAYADALSILAAFAVDKLAVYNNGLCTWNPTNQNINQIFTKQTVSMIWDFSEASPLFGGLCFESLVDGIAGVVELLPASAIGRAHQMDCAAAASCQNYPAIVSTDPPYYDNMGYADLSDFFYYWLRLSLRSRFPELFSTLLVPKTEELIASPHRHEGKEAADKFFMDGMTRAMRQLSKEAHPSFPVTIYYAFKQSETKGWETFLTAVVNAGFAVTGTWPIRTERKTRPRGQGSNALASSVILVCRSRSPQAPAATRRDFLEGLKTELPGAVRQLQHSNIAPVDLPQSAIGPGMAVYTRYAKVLDAKGNALTVREALALINDVLDEVLSAQEGDFDADTRWAIAWFEQYGFGPGEYGIAENLSKAKSTSISALARAGIVLSKSGTVRLYRPSELPISWDPRAEAGVPVWEIAHHMIRVLEDRGEGAAADLMSRIGTNAEAARELCYRLYTICERKKRPREGLSYNGLVQSWPELLRLVRDSHNSAPAQTDMFE